MVFRQKGDTVSAKNIASGQTFYIYINASSGVEKISKINVKVKDEIIKARIAVLKPVYDASKQTLLVEETRKASRETEKTFTVNIPLTIKIVRNKTDKDTGKA